MSAITKTVSVPTDYSQTKPALADFIELTKPRIAIMILIAVGITAFVSVGTPDILLLFNTLVGVLFVSASGSAINQFIERYTDWLMPRTSNRPLPARRLSASGVALFGAVTLGIGISYLVMLVNWQSAVVAMITWILYAWVYTPLKVVTSLNTYVGAIAGAMPILIGVVGQNPGVPPIGWAIFAIMFVWQFPHFMAIAWKYRKDYAEGGLKMFPVTDPSGHSTGLHALVFALLHFPISIWAIWLVAGFHPVFLVATILLCISYLIPSIGFWKEQNLPSSRRLLLSSLVFLPAMLLLILAAKIIFVFS